MPRSTPLVEPSMKPEYIAFVQWLDKEWPTWRQAQKNGSQSQKGMLMTMERVFTAGFLAGKWRIP